jgi:ABC-type sugar transport system ATPase subunit
LRKVAAFCVMATVNVRHLGVKKPSAAGRPGSLHAILEDISLDIEDGELLVLIGPSGCGKSTLLRCIAGLETPSQGEIVIDGQVVNELPPRDRDIAMVFQSYALYPHMTVFDNLAFGLRMRRTPPDEVARRVAEAAEMLEIEHLVERFPRELSGGQRQRVAMGRAVVRRPRVFLFDEPLSNLDAALRQQMRLELMRLHKNLKATTVYVTHDQVEAMTLAHRIAVLNQGRLVQLGAPTALYDRPISPFVARFFGTPEMNLVSGRVTAGTFEAIGETPGEPLLRLSVSGYPDGAALLGVRAEHLLFVSNQDAAAGPPPIKGRVDVVEHLGSETLVHVRVGKQGLVARCAVEATPAAGSDVDLAIAPGRFHLFSPPQGAQDGARLVARG